MVNFRDPAVVAKDNCAYGFLQPSLEVATLLIGFFFKVALLKLWHVVDGIFL
jgi:hypothetical protein